MQDLRLLGTSEDGSRLVLQSPEGETYGLRLDERLHAALRGDRARLGQLQIELDHELRPREIQARIRAGESAEQIAESAGVPLEAVRRFEGPIQLERTHVSDLARSTNVRRVTDAAARPLGELVAERLEARGVPADALVWDSWRRDDGRWLVRLAYSHAGRDHHASWVFDPSVRTVEPADDEARWLTEEERAVPEHREPRRQPVRLAAVPTVEESEPADDGEPAEQPGAEAPGDVSAEVLGPVPSPPAPPQPAHDASWIPGFGSTPAVEPEPVDGPAEAPRKGRHRRTRAEVPPAIPEEGAEAAPRTTRPRRASVLSWDEILFGSSKPED